MKKLLSIVFILLINNSYSQNISNNVQAYLIPTTSGCNVVTYFPIGYDFSKQKSVQRSWSGRCNKNNRLEGYGVFITLNSETNVKIITTSNFVNGLEQGTTTVEKTTPKLREVFSGTYLNGSKSYGTLSIVYFDGSSKIYYEGNFKDGQLSGEGNLYQENSGGKWRYIGNFENGVENGLGTYYFLQENRSWRGNFTNGKMNGVGTFFWENGRMSTVQYVNDEEVSREDVPPPQLTPQQIREIFPPTPSIVPFSCTTYGGTTSCR